MSAEDDCFGGVGRAGVVQTVNGGNDLGKGEGYAVVDASERFAIRGRDKNRRVGGKDAWVKSVEDCGRCRRGVGEGRQSEPFAG